MLSVFDEKMHRSETRLLTVTIRRAQGNSSADTPSATTTMKPEDILDCSPAATQDCLTDGTEAPGVVPMSRARLVFTKQCKMRTA